MNTLRQLVTLALLALVMACSSADYSRAIPAHEVLTSDLAIDPFVYALLPGDEIEVRFFYTPELDTTLIVRLDGRISLPFAQGIQAAGLTPERLSADLKLRYQGELLNPEIAVIVRNSAGHRVHVGGQVGEPGVLQSSGQLRVFDAVLQAGGLLPSAHQEQVLVIRQRTERAGGEELGVLMNSEVDEIDKIMVDPQVILVDLRAFLEEGDTRQNILLAADDVVYVPKSRIANINQWVDQNLRQNLPFNVTAGYRVE